MRWHHWAWLIVIVLLAYFAGKNWPNIIPFVPRMGGGGGGMASSAPAGQ